MNAIVIAGNGPSLAEIDYTLLPKRFDVYRCNQFYFENQYFLGKKIKGVFFNPGIFSEQFFTLYHIKKNKEYLVEDVYCQRADEEDLLINGKKFESFFPTVKSTYPLLKKIPEFNELDKFYRLYFHQCPTMSIIMLYTAIAQGYKEIYLTGVDFYEKGNLSYAFGFDQLSNLAKKFDLPTPFGVSDIIHTKQLDTLCIQLACSLPDINIYSVNPNGPLSNLLPLSKIKNNTPMQLEQKPKEFISDLVLPKQNQQCNFIQKLKAYGIDGRNTYIKLIRDLVYLIRAIIYALKN